MTGRKIWWGVALGLALSGCVSVPGSNIDLGRRAPDHDAAVDLSQRMNVHAITPELLADLKKPVAPPTGNPDLDKALSHYEYRVGPGDVLNVVVWDHPELNNPLAAQRMSADLSSSSAGGGASAASGGAGGSSSGGGTAATSAVAPGVWVDADGTIYFPYIGSVKVAGLTRGEVRTLLRERLSRFLVEPQVDVTVLAYRAQRVYVTGEVRQPTTLPLTNVPLTVLDAINQCGGVAADADWKNVVLTRKGHEYHYSLRDLFKHGDTRQNALLEPGDVLFVPATDNNKVFVLGEIKKSGSVLMTPNGMSLAEALSEAGGISELTANAAGIFVLRRSESADKLVDVYQLNAQDATTLVLADAFPLQERDIVYVTAAPVSRWNRLINQLLPSVDVLYLQAQAKQNGF